MSSHILRWREAAEWRPKVVTALADFLTPGVIEAARSSEPGYLSSAPPEWLEEIVSEHHHPPDVISVVSALAERLPRLFGRVRAFHGCRPANAVSYLSDGILPLSRSRQREIALAIFTEGSRAPFTREQVLNAADQIDENETGGRVYLALDDRELLQHSSHYLVSGSEYLQAIASELWRQTGRDATDLLRGRGVPTVFIADLPWRYFNAEAREYLSNALLSALFFDMEADTAPSIDFTVTSRRKVEPRYIGGHYHPAELEDPHRGYARYQVQVRECGLCASSPAA